ncbi:hypothetical protein K439DRAFT_1618123 [Ramaria rubella]|nr:hypothetical protein K439DRAFT_1618123 [Ramaria rubella]
MDANASQLQVVSGPWGLTVDANTFHFRELLSTVSQFFFAASVMVLSLYKAYGIVEMLGGIKNAFTESRFKLMWLIIIEGSRRLIICGLMILETLFPLANINNLAVPFSLPIEAILVSCLLLELRELEQNTNQAASIVLVTIPTDADGLPLIMRNPLNDAENTGQEFFHSGSSQMMDASLDPDDDRQTRDSPGRDV